MASNVSENLSAQYNSYHLNNYLIHLNNLWKKKNLRKHIQKDALIKSLSEYQLQMLVDKHQVDVNILDRGEQFKFNHDNYNDWLSFIKNFSSHQTIESHTLMQKNEGFSLTNSIKNTISSINGQRLDHGVWSRNLVEVLILFLGVTTPELSQLIKIVSLCNGYASYGFYIARGGLDAICGIKHLAFKNDVYDEHGLTLADRFAFQSEQRYQRFINDICLWAPVNFLTFHYLKGTGTLGLVGNALTVVLLVGDMSLSMYVYQHKKKQFAMIQNNVKKTLKAKGISDKDIAFYLKGLQEVHAQEQEKLEYTIYYQLCLVLFFSLLLVNSTPCLLIASISIFLLQILMNEKDFYLDLVHAPEGSPEAMVLQFKMLMKLLEHIIVPAVFIFAGLVVMPMLANPSPWLFLLACVAVDSLVLYASNQITENFENSVNTKALKAS